MAEMSQKMQLRAALMSILNKYRNIDDSKNIDISNDVETLRSLKDNDYVAKTLFKEINNDNKFFVNICAIIALEIVEHDCFEKYAIEFLKNKEIDDEKKFFMISLIKQKGIPFDYEDILKYVKNPEEIAQNGVDEFLNDILFEPEVQIDLLDFYTNIPYEEKLYLLDNLSQEKLDDNVIRAFSLIAQLDLTKQESDFILKILISSRSPYAKEGLEHLSVIYDEDKIKLQSIKKAIKAIEFQNRNFKDDDITRNTIVYESLISFVDGNSDFSIILTRQNPDLMLNCAFLTINIEKGLTSCMGFSNLSHGGYQKIKQRLFTDSFPVNTSPSALKSILYNYLEKNKITKTKLPYEFIVWKKLFNGINIFNYPIEEYIHSRLQTINLNQSKVKKVLFTKMLSTWYFCYHNNSYFDNLVEKIENEKISDFDEITKYVKNSCKNEFLKDEAFLDKLNQSLMMNAYVAYMSELKATSQIIYSLCFKNDYMESFIECMIDKSLYNYFSQALDEDEENKFKLGRKTNFSKSQLRDLMNIIEKKWE